MPSSSLPLGQAQDSGRPTWRPVSRGGQVGEEAPRNGTDHQPGPAQGQREAPLPAGISNNCPPRLSRPAAGVDDVQQKIHGMVCGGHGADVRDVEPSEQDKAEVRSRIEYSEGGVVPVKVMAS